MAITTYSELQSAMVGWSNRSDLSARLGEFISLAEARLNDMLLLKDYESDEDLTLTQDANYVAIPSGFISPIAFWLIVDGERVSLDKRLPEDLPYFTDSTQPREWAIDGVNIRFDCPADQAYAAKFRMRKTANLSDSNTTNYLLTRRPDVYLAGSMVELFVYTRNKPMADEWEVKFTMATKGLAAAENRSRSVELRTDIPARGRSNIIRGE